MGSYLEFAGQVGAVGETGAGELVRRCRKALLAVAAEQSGHHAEADPVDRFLALLPSLISSGRAYIRDDRGGRPEHRPEAFGWRADGALDDPQSEWSPQGRCIGWVEGDDLYLDSEAAYAEAQRLAGEQGEPIAINRPTLHKRLHERGLLRTVEGGRGKLQVRRMLGGARRDVLHLGVSEVLPLAEGGPIGPVGPAEGDGVGPCPDPTTAEPARDDVPF